MASNGREVEQFALEACVRRQTSGERVPPPKINDDTLDDAFERCREVTAEAVCVLPGHEAHDPREAARVYSHLRLVQTHG